MKYIDRVDETNYLKDLYDSLTENTILIVYSGTGVGKSTLSKRFIEKINNRNEIAIVPVYSNKINNDKTAKGTYLMSIFKSFRIYFHHDENLSFEKYVLNDKDKAHRKYILEKIVKDIKKSSTFKSIIFKAFGTFFINRFFKLGYYNCDALVEDLSTESIQLVNGYIEYVLKNKQIVLSIDNLQNADNYSIEKIKNWIALNKTKKHFFICEYTVSKDLDRLSVLNLRDSLLNFNVSVQLMELSAMDSNYAIQAATIKNDNQSEILIPPNTGEVYLNNNGNIRYLEDYIRHYNSVHHNKISYTPTMDNILSLNKNELFVFCIICNNEASINRYELQHLLHPYKINLTESLKILSKELDLVEEKDYEITIKHAWVFDSWQQIKDDKIKIINLNAYDVLCSHYNKLLNNIESSSTKKAFLALLKLHSKYDTEQIYTLINQFDELAIEFISPDQIQSYIKELDSQLEDNRENFIDFYYKMINMCLDVKLYADADYLLNKIKDVSPVYKYIFYKCNIYIQSEDFEKNINFINCIINNIENDYFILYLKLFLMISYRSINDYESVKIIDSEICASVQKYSGTVFYAYYLRLAEIRKPRNFAIDDVNKSVRLFKKLNLETQAAKSKVTLSFLYTISNNIHQAQELLNSAEKTIMKEVVNKHIFLNNKAAIYMLTGNVSSEVGEMLNKAEYSAITIFDKLAIYNNQLAYSIENKFYDNAKLVLSRIKNILESEKDKHLCAIVYYNMYLYYKITKDYRNADIYYAKCYSLKEHCNSLNARLTNTSTVDNTDILCSKKWHVAFMDFWFLDYVEDFQLLSANEINDSIICV